MGTGAQRHIGNNGVVNEPAGLPGPNPPIPPPSRSLAKYTDPLRMVPDPIRGFISSLITRQAALVFVVSLVETLGGGRARVGRRLVESELRLAVRTSALQEGGLRSNHVGDL